MIYDYWCVWFNAASENPQTTSESATDTTSHLALAVESLKLIRYDK